MLRLRKNDHILKTLLNREIGAVTSSYKLTLNIMYQLVTEDERTFYPTWDTKSRKRIVQENGKLIFDNFTRVYSLWGKDNKPSKCFQVKDYSGHRIVDVLQCSMGVFRHGNDVNYKSMEGYYLALFDNNWLCSYHFETGALQNEIFLGHFENNFKHCDWDIYRQQITIMTNIGKKVVLIAVFTVAPLEFRALMPVDKSIFTDKRCSKINVSDSLLIVGLGSLTNGTVRIYNFASILDENIAYTAKLGETCPVECPCDVSSIVGSYSHGIPVNCKLKTVPPILFEVNNCANLTVDFGGKPWHYIITDAFKNFSVMSFFDVRRVSDHSLAVNGTLSEDNTVFPDATAYFHYDNSGRIIHVLPHVVNVYKLITIDDSSKLEIVNTLKISKNQIIYKRLQCHQKPLEPEVSVKECPVSKRAQRVARIESLISTSLQPLKTVLALDYENELDLNVVLGYDPDHFNNEDMSALVNFYDNFNGHLVKSVKLPTLVLDECDDYDINMELDTLVIIVRIFGTAVLYRTYVFKLTECDTICEQNNMIVT